MGRQTRQSRGARAARAPKPGQENERQAQGNVSCMERPKRQGKRRGRRESKRQGGRRKERAQEGAEGPKHGQAHSRAGSRVCVCVLQRLGLIHRHWLHHNSQQHAAMQQKMVREAGCKNLCLPRP